MEPELIVRPLGEEDVDAAATIETLCFTDHWSREDVYKRQLMMRITILSLTASPDLRLSDLGLVDGKRQRFVPLFPEV